MEKHKFIRIAKAGILNCKYKYNNSEHTHYFFTLKSLEKFLISKVTAEFLIIDHGKDN